MIFHPQDYHGQNINSFSTPEGKLDPNNQNLADLENHTPTLITHQEFSPIIFSSSYHQAKSRHNSQSTLVINNLPADIIRTFLTNLHQQSHSKYQLEILPLAISVNNRLVVQSTLVRGYEDGLNPVDLENWQIPYEVVLQALDIQTSQLPDGQLELRSAHFILGINPKELTLDPELGRVIKIKDIQELFDVVVKFDINSYTLLIQAPWLDQTPSQITRKKPEIITLDGLPKVKSPLFSFSHLLHDIQFNSSHNHTIQSSASFQAIGTAFQGGWSLGVQQGNILENPKFQINSFQWVNSDAHQDYIVGQQQTLWPRTFFQQYWGVSLVQRHGYTLSPTQSTNIEQRNQAADVKRTIQGKAEPGTFVVLRPQSDTKNILGEILVDETGIYRFPDVSSGVFVIEKYPRGRLTAQPQVKVINLAFTPGQLSSGTSSSVFSAGWLYQPPFPQTSEIIGNFSNFQAGIKKKWGVSESLTLGIGAFYHGNINAIGELFFHPQNVPLSVYLSANTQDRIKYPSNRGSNIYTRIKYRISNNTQINLNGDLYSQTLNFNHQLNLNQSTTMQLFSNIQNTGTGSLQISLRQNDDNFNTQISLDKNQNLNFNNTLNLAKAYKNFIFTFRTNLSGIDAEIKYNLPKANTGVATNQIALRYQGYQKNYDILTNPIPQFPRNFLELSWQYAQKNGLQWRIGSGLSNDGSGINATLSIPMLSGLNLSARYQSISQFSHGSSFQIQINSSFNLQQGFRTINQKLATQGLFIQPFLDKNSNHKLDQGDEIITEDLEELLLINHQSISQYQSEWEHDGIRISLPPGNYRLDLNTTGFPPQAQTLVPSYAIEIAPGSFTTLPIPFSLTHPVESIVNYIQN
ncbi:hypothetical protein NWP22_11890 [Anabaenopsis tanganyikae CS-531]|uniref:Uncharacterized protein n=1 Tax=Anabaenopsis tanganyikae CS-531 TaxID=2785304 RepID=A0ABT6KFN3_9CYAN|nr:hypothetical protein [Anabaenopsis tanganyikae]MDH6106561.1 hypothetical protein [Anabaenopsis tanganyikae CS-531]